MPLGPVDILNALEIINWSAVSSQSTLLANFGYENGICGRAKTRYQEKSPHHVHQVHGTDIVEASAANTFDGLTRPQADGIFTTKSRVISVKTADCLPIIMASRNTKFAMAVHAGWRGLTKGILLRALTLADQFTKRDDLVVCIGPAISREAFEVGREVVDQLMRSLLMQANGNIWPLCVGKGFRDRWHVDLQVAAAIQLLLGEVNPVQIEVIRSCTRDQKTSLDNCASHASYAWHSYRRDGKNCGSNWTWIQPT